MKIGELSSLAGCSVPAVRFYEAEGLLQAPLRAAGVKVHLIGGADVAAELDAKRAIDQGSRLAAAF